MNLQSLLSETPPPTGKADLDYAERAQEQLNVAIRLDASMVQAQNLQLYRQEKDRLASNIARTDALAASFLDRVTVEDILGGGTNTKPELPPTSTDPVDAAAANGNPENGSLHGRFWGTTRQFENPDIREQRRTILTDRAAEYLAMPAQVSDDYFGDSKPGKRGSTAAATASTSAAARAGQENGGFADPGVDSIEDADYKRRRVDDREEKFGRTRGSKENGRLRIRQSMDEGEDSHSVGPVDDASDKSFSPTKLRELKLVQKQYDNTFVAIWKDLLRKDGPKALRLLQQTTQTRLVNFKKTAVLALREARRWQLKNNKNQKDLTSKARRTMREMFHFWKRSERLERDQKKRLEREHNDKAKREEDDREARRQLRKLNFLISQTELYLHFISKKIKTLEIEGLDADPNLGHGESAVSELDKYHGVEGAKTDIGSLDFDQDDDDNLQRAAAANAQSALDSARARALEFDEFKNPDTNGEEMNFQNPTLLGDLSVDQPELLKCTLKEYQLKGLNWLANLYEQGINGILADEMGLGKTVQSISVLAYLAETHNIWGPYLVVTPASTLHNWQQEISRFVPEFKVLPYWGNGKDRKILRKFWDRKSLRYGKDAPFHVLVTSYQLVVADAPYFQKMKWQYMILDEAQAIKSSQSSRWKSLLSFSCRNRLLLTGTPIQNSMQELWALLHFIMPSLFDSHDEFSDWFSKDIESHAQSNTQLNELQLKRLHVILKPFMLRRVKKNVQSELGDKVEIDIYCDLTQRQKKYYLMLKSQISIADLLSNANNDDSNLMNLVMQFRKVCNHPDLFERADVKSGFAFGTFAETGSFLRETELECSYSLRNPIACGLPKLVYHDLLTPGFDNNVGSKDHILKKFSIYDPENIRDDLLDNFGWLKFVDVSSTELRELSKQTEIERAMKSQKYSDINYERVSRFRYLYEDELAVPQSKKLLIQELNNIHPEISGSKEPLQGLYSIKNKVYEDMYVNVLEPAYVPKALSAPVDIECSSYTWTRKMNDAMFEPSFKQQFAPLTLNTELALMTNKVPISEYPRSNLLPESLNKLIDYSNIRMPSMSRFITESGKLLRLDSLLDELKANDHRVLVYFQMTKMMDLMEEFLTFRKHSYIRLDGSSKLEDRRDLVNDWQTKPDLFVFLLSTRAGGLGINLTAADTVIFYDSDWNPTIDSQAMDRAHRLGQTKQVTVYRLLTKGTIEERMRDRAKQKEQVQQVVMEGKANFGKMKEDAASKKKDVAYLLLGGDDHGSDTSNGSSEQNGNGSSSVAISALTSDNSTPAVDAMTRMADMYHEGEGKFSGTMTPTGA